MWRLSKNPAPRSGSRYRRWEMRVRSLAWAVLSLVGIGLSPAATKPPEQIQPPVSLESRVEAVRKVLAAQHQPFEDPGTQARTLQWGNWPNWNNWGNWPNWGNWNNY